MTDGGQWQQGQPQNWNGQYGPPPYGPPQYGPPQYGPPGYGSTPYGPPGYGPPPYGPGWPRRPGVATAAAVLGIVTGALALVGGLLFSVAAMNGGDDLPTYLLVLGIPIGAGLLVAGTQLLGRRAAGQLLWLAVTAVVVLVLALVSSVGTLTAEEGSAVLAVAVLGLPLPIVTVALVAQRTVRDWSALR